MVSSADIRQAMAVVDQDVIAVEAVEVTDRMIDRAGVVVMGGSGPRGNCGGDAETGRCNPCYPQWG
jgi:DUF1009 family protein